MLYVLTFVGGALVCFAALYLAGRQRRADVDALVQDLQAQLDSSNTVMTADDDVRMGEQITIVKTDEDTGNVTKIHD